MFDIGPEKLLLILAVALVFLGPKKIPEIARSLGKGLREFRKAQSDVRDELMGSLDDEDTSPPALTSEQDTEKPTRAPTNGHNAEGIGQ